MSARKQLAIAFGGFAASIALAIPTAASAGLVDDVLGGVNDTVNEAVGGVSGGGSGSSGVSSGAPAPAPVPAAGPETEPPLSGTNPHGQGAVIDTEIDSPVAPLGVTVGESRGEQDSQGKYHGVVKVVSVTGLGNPVEIAIETDEGETDTGPVGPVNDALDDLCTASDVCLNVLDYNSSTDGDGSDNSFSAVRLGTPSDLVTAGVLESEGNISETNECQTAEGSSRAANVGAIGGAVEADALRSSSRSRACSDGTENTNSDSAVAQLNGTGLLAGLGCDEDQVDDEFPDAPLNALILGVCNGDDTNGAQADAPYNVRKALGVAFPVLAQLGVDLRIDAAKSESIVVAPDTDTPEPECPDPDNPRCDDPGDPDGPNQNIQFGGGNGTGELDSGSLPFTGADLGVLGLIGALVMGGGLGLMALADRRRAAND